MCLSRPEGQLAERPASHGTTHARRIQFAFVLVRRCAGMVRTSPARCTQIGNTTVLDTGTVRDYWLGQPEARNEVASAKAAVAVLQYPFHWALASHDVAPRWTTLEIH